MTRKTTQSPLDPSGRKPSDTAVATEALVQVLAELQRITGDHDPKAPLRGNARPVVGPGQGSRPEPRTPVAAQRNRQLTRIAVAGGALLVAGLLALPLSEVLFTSGVLSDMSEPASDSGPTPETVASKGPLAMSEPKPETRLVGLVGPADQSPRAPESVPAAGNADEPVMPLATASIGPGTGKAPPEVRLPPVDLPGPLHIVDVAPIVAKPVMSEVRTETSAPSSAAPPQRVSDTEVSSKVAELNTASGTAVAALGDIAVALPRQTLSSPATPGLLARAQELIRTRDISSARLLLKRALSLGSAQAAFHLAETYDPRMLSEWQVLGISGDAARAKELYARAANEGVASAGERLKTMQ